MLAVCAVLAGFGAVTEDAAILTIGTEGPDRYADGSAVLDGECYALVWRQSATAPFAGFNVDGTLVDPQAARVLCCLPSAEGGRCPVRTYVIDAALLRSCGTGGSFALYLLDSRRWTADGTAVPAGLSGVHGFVLVRETTSIASFQTARPVTAAFAASEVPSTIPPPRIVGMRVADDAVVLTVADTAPALNYNVSAGDAVSATTVAAAAERPVAGSAAPIELRVPRAQFGDKAFFKVVRNPLER